MRDERDRQKQVSFFHKYPLSIFIVSIFFILLFSYMCISILIFKNIIVLKVWFFHFIKLIWKNKLLEIINQRVILL
jgi:hypothetical protein